MDASLLLHIHTLKTPTQLPNQHLKTHAPGPQDERRIVCGIEGRGVVIGFLLPPDEGVLVVCI
jgi:hypothetical protein